MQLIVCDRYQEGSVIFTLCLFAWLSDHRWKQIAFDTVALFCGVYSSSVRILFSILCRLVADHFKMIEHQMECLTTRNDNSQIDHSVNLKKLQHQHALVCRSVDHMNSSFGFFLLLDILYFFISFTVYAMYFLVFSINGNSQWSESMIIITGFFYNLTSLAITCFSSNLILKQVIQYLICTTACNIRLTISLFVPCLGESFNSSHISTFATHTTSAGAASKRFPYYIKTASIDFISKNMFFATKIHAFAAQMSQMSPQIDALGFFNVSLHIFPTVRFS